MNENIEESEKIESGNNWTFFLATISILLIAYCLYYIINLYLKNDILFNPSTSKINNPLSLKLQPNEIGDTMGGIINPIIAFTASILTFLAFYIQFKANNEQKQIYYKNLEREKNKIIDNNKTTLRIFKTLISSSITHYQESSQHIQKFVKAEIENPLSMNIFSFLTSNSYETYSKLEFKDIYSAIFFNFKDSTDEWEKDFANSILTIDYYDKLLKEMKNKYENHVSSKVKLLNQIGEDVNNKMNDIFSNEILKDLDGTDDYMEIVYNKLPDGSDAVPADQFSFPDINKLNDVFFNKIITDLYLKFKASGDLVYKENLDFFSNLRKKLSGEKLQTINYAQSLEEKYENYFENQDELTKVQTFLNKIDTNHKLASTTNKT